MHSTNFQANIKQPLAIFDGKLNVKHFQHNFPYILKD